MEKQRAWIHCRVLTNSSRNLLNYQEELLKDIAEQLDFSIVGVTKLISNGKSLDQFEMQALLHHIQSKKIDVVLVYSPKRISIFEDVYEEFEMLCLKHHVSILSIDDLQILNDSLVIR